MGELSLTEEQRLRAPGGGPPIEHLRFVVRGDGLLRIQDPESLQGIEGIPPAARLGSRDALVELLRRGLDERFAHLRDHAAKLRNFGLEVGIDAARMRLVGRMDLGPLGTALLESDGAHLVAHELLAKDSDRSEPLPLGDVAIDLRAFDDRMDLELFLASHAERVAPERSPGLFVSGHLAREAVANAEQIGALVAGLTPPLAGERWVMDVKVESDDGEEVRYRGVNLAGSAFGAPRVLPKPAFDAVYQRTAEAHRMTVQVVEVYDENVSYVKLNDHERPDGPAREVSLAGFLANFTPEPGAI